jgi:pimeloyl-ACP methyl ester carboxylesterase
MNKFLQTIFSSITTFFILSLLPVAANAAETADGHWEGNIAVMEMNLKIMVDIDTKKKGSEATIDIPQQGAKALALKNFLFKAPDIFFDLESPNGKASFIGVIKGNKITGTFKQAGIIGKFNLEKGLAPIADNVQEIENLPYKQEEVTFKNGEIPFTGTLTLPEIGAPFPTVVMITGSGAQNRDEEIFGFKIFKIIADHFTRHGIAVLRYDDRGVGGSGGNFSEATTADFATDVEAAVKFLKTRKDIGKIGLFGHSEGGIIAPIVASRNSNIDFIILLAGTSVNGAEILSAQNELISKANGLSKEEIEVNGQLQQMMYQAMKNNIGWDKVEKELTAKITESINKLPPEQRKQIGDAKEYTANMVKNQIAASKSPWLRYFIDFDPSTVLEKVKVPVLALFGELDLQVPTLLNAAPMEKALKKAGNKQYTVKVFPKANHLFQEATTGSPNEYVALKKEFVPGLLDYITDWILNLRN